MFPRNDQFFGAKFVQFVQNLKFCGKHKFLSKLTKIDSSAQNQTTEDLSKYLQKTKIIILLH